MDRWFLELTDHVSGSPLPQKICIRSSEPLVLGRAPGPLGITLCPDPALIGSGPAGAKFNPETVLSRRHCQLLLLPDSTLAVEDLGSGNRTRVNQQRLTPSIPQSLSDGDVITLGLKAWGVSYAFRENAVVNDEDDSQVTEIGSEPEAGWTCSACTLRNPSGLDRCTVCDTAAGPEQPCEEQRTCFHPETVTNEILWTVFAAAGAVGREAVPMVCSWFRRVADSAKPWPCLSGVEVMLDGNPLPALGLGMLPLGVTYSGGGRPTRADSLALLHCAFDLGVRFVDTSDMYCEGPGDEHYAECLLNEALKTYPREWIRVFVGTKCGMRRVNSSARGWFPAEYTPEELTKRIQAQRAALGRPIDLWSFHHTDGYAIDVPDKFKHAMHAVAYLVRQGIILNVGLCNCSTAHIEIASKIVPIQAVQNEYSLWNRAAEGKRVRAVVAKSNKNEIIAACAQKSILFCPYGALGGHQSREGRRDLNEDFPTVARLAASKEVSTQVLVLAWMRAQFPFVLHIVGTRKIDHLQDILRNVPLVRLAQDEIRLFQNLKPNSKK